MSSRHVSEIRTRYVYVIQQSVLSGGRASIRFNRREEAIRKLGGNPELASWRAQ